MPNKYSFDGNTKDRMFVYQRQMEQYDLNSDAIRTFANAIKEGNLKVIQDEFGELDDNQKRGLLNLFIDYADISRTTSGMGNMNAPTGRAIDLAKQFQHPQIVEFLILQRDYLDAPGKAFTEGAVAGTLNKGEKSKRLPEELGRFAGSFLGRKEGGRAAQTTKDADKLGKESQRTEEERLKASNTSKKA